jgi:2-keto-4-pentenoate hydratase/2-oxohepta-3-ene-1,7-dioic acid hydratase in catechol pathway
MRLVSVIDDGARRAGVLEGDDVFVTEASGLDVAIAQGLDLKAQSGVWRKRKDVVLDAPLRPGIILCTGSNYLDHLEERIPASAGLNAPKKEMEFFIKAGQTIADLSDPLRLDPSIGSKIDQETEVGLVLRPGCPRNIPEKRALDYVFGLLVVNDVTARDKQVRMLPDGSNFMVLGASKNFDGSTRFSDSVITLDEIPDVYDLSVETYLNGELKQRNSTGNLINNFHRIISFFSESLTLGAAGVISTGTPGGTGWGQDRELSGNGFVPPNCTPNRYLSNGDEVRSVVGGVGEILFRVE